ncbi:hypothetical protein Btru_017476 [Bulinus truncatus]|nr:hypothetical protein Btru_017476 [Bulinus truncatus]
MAPAMSKCQRSSGNSSNEVFVDECKDEKDVNDDNSTEDRVLSFCPAYTWGPNCDQSCSNCSDICDQDYGVCTHCKPGYKYPFASCTLGMA